MALAAPDITEPVPVEITNTDDVYDPARIDALRAEGLNNREIGIRLREEGSAPAAADMMLLEPTVTELMQPAQPMSEAVVQTMNVSAGTVNVSGGAAGAPMPVTIANADEIQPIIENKVEIK